MQAIISFDVRKSVDEVRVDLISACVKHKFGVLAVHDLRAKMREKGVPFETQCLVFEVCNPQAAKQALESDMRIATALPCRIAVFDAGAKTRISTIRPQLLLELFGGTPLVALARDVEETLVAIMKEASGLGA